MIEKYERWGEFESWGIPQAIIREQIAVLPTQRIKEIMLKYGGLDDNLKGYLEKVSNDDKIDENYISYHLSSFIENTLKNYVIYNSNKKEDKIDESLFEPDW